MAQLKEGTTIGTGLAWHSENDGAASGLDADKLDGQEGSFYLDYANQTGTPTIGNGTLTLSVSGTGLSGSATFSANQTGPSSYTVTSNATSANTASTIVARDASGNFEASRMRGNLSLQRATRVASGISWYNDASYTSWCDYMSTSVGVTTAGPTGNITPPAGTLVTTWGMRSFIENVSGYGWTWESGTQATTTPSIVAEMSSQNGNFRTIGTIQGTALTSTVATGTAPLTVTSTTRVNNLNVATAGTADTLTTARDFSITGNATAAAVSFNGGANVALNVTSLTAGGLSGTIPSAVLGNSALFVGTTSIALNRASASQALTGITSIDGSAATLTTARTIAISGGATGTATSFNGSANISIPVTDLNATNLSAGTVPGARGVTSGSASSSFLTYNGTTAAAGQLDGGTTTPTGTTRLNYGGHFYPTSLVLLGTADTATAATHYFVETGSDSVVRPKTIANVRTEIVTTASVNATNLTSTGTVTSGTWSSAFGAVSGANLTNLTAGNLAGTIPSAVLGNSTHFIGTTSIALNRASAAQALTGITSIDGSAATLTTGRTIAITGAVTGTATSFNGSANISIPVTAVDVASASITGALAADHGGTGQSVYAVGDILYASTTTALSKLPDVATGNALISGGVNTAPSWGKIGLTTHVSGTLPIANGGTNSTATPTNGGVIYGTGTAYAASAAGTSGQVLTSNGAAAPTWSSPSYDFTQATIDFGTNIGCARTARHMPFLYRDKLFCFGETEHSEGNDAAPGIPLSGANPHLINSYAASFSMLTVGTECVFAYSPVSQSLYAGGTITTGNLGLNVASGTSPFVEVATLLGATPVIATTSTVSAVKCSGYINSTNVLHVTGDNTQGQLGLGNTTATNVFTVSTLPTGAATAKNFFPIGYTNYAISTDATSNRVFAAGDNTNGQIGDNTTGTDRTSWTQVQITGGGNLDSVVKLKATCQGNTSVCAFALRSNGDLYGRGYNAGGQIGNGTTTNVTRAFLILTNVIDFEISGAENPVVMAYTSSNLYLWGGIGTTGATYFGLTTNQTTPQTIGLPSGVSAAQIDKIWGTGPTYNQLSTFWLRAGSGTHANKTYAIGRNTAAGSNGWMGIGDGTNAVGGGWRQVKIFERITDIQAVSSQVSGSPVVTTFFKTVSGHMFAAGYNNVFFGDSNSEKYVPCLLTKPVI